MSHFILLALLSFFAPRAHAVESNDILFLTVTGHYVMTPPVGGYENTTSTDLTGNSGGISLGYRFSEFSIEAGVEHFKDAWRAPYSLNGVTHLELVNYESMGIPLIAKWNYLEDQLAMFYVKAGGCVNFNVVSTDTDLVPTSYVSSIVGVGGTSQLNESIAFILDFSVIQNFGFSSFPNPNVSAGIGFLFSL